MNGRMRIVSLCNLTKESLCRGEEDFILCLDSLILTRIVFPFSVSLYIFSAILCMLVHPGCRFVCEI